MKLNDDRDKISYIIGEDIGNSIAKEDYDLNLDILVEAIHLAAEKRSENLMTEQEKNNVMSKWQQEMQKKKQAKDAEESKVSKKEGEDFLNNNRKNANVKETPSGLQYTVITEVYWQETYKE
jgi:FKBP-type peptidyl-prolyl cis-trans isomerase